MKMNARLGFMAGFLAGCHEDKGVDGISWQKASEYAMKMKSKRKNMAISTLNCHENKSRDVFHGKKCLNMP